MIKSRLGDRLDGWVHTALPFLFRRPVNPNLVTISGAVVSMGAALAFAAGWFTTGGLLILAGGFFDLVDGAIARHHGIETRFGAFLDSTVDRLVDMAVLLGVTMYYAVEGEPGLVLLSGYALAVSVLISYSKARAEQLVASFHVGVLERGERLAILAAGALFGFMVLALWIIAIGGTITVIQRIARAHREMERLDADERAGLRERT